MNNEKTYAEKDATRTVIKWRGLNCTMLGTLSDAGIFRRLDGGLCRLTDAQPFEAVDTVNDAQYQQFIANGKWLFTD